MSDQDGVELAVELCRALSCVDANLEGAVPVRLTEEVGDMDGDGIFRLTINCTWHHNALER